jgi:hypothetical protein
LSIELRKYEQIWCQSLVNLKQALGVWHYALEDNSSVRNDDEGGRS